MKLREFLLKTRGMNLDNDICFYSDDREDYLQIADVTEDEDGSIVIISE